MQTEFTKETGKREEGEDCPVIIFLFYILIFLDKLGKIYMLTKF